MRELIPIVVLLCLSISTHAQSAYQEIREGKLAKKVNLFES